MSMLNEDIGAILEESPAPETSSEEQENTENTVPESETEEDKPSENAEDSEPSDEEPYHKNPRFKKVIEEKNAFKTKAETLESENEQLKQKLAELENGKKEPKAEEKPATTENVFGKFNDLLGNQTYPFKDAAEYKTIQELYNDIRDAVITDVMTLQNNARTKIETEKKQQIEVTQKAAKESINYIENYFGEDKDRQDKFETFVIEESKKNPKLPDIKTLISIWERFNPKTEDKKTSVADRIGKNKTAATSGGEKFYDPVADRNKSIMDLID